MSVESVTTRPRKFDTVHNGYMIEAGGMNNLICPISKDVIDKSASRIGAALTALLLVAYVFTGFWPLLVFVVADYVIRVFSSLASPIALTARSITKLLRIPPKRMNKGPKIFAWRIGLLMAAASLVLLPFSTTASYVVALVLAGFSFFDGAFNFCVGCAIYTYVVLPYAGTSAKAE